MENTLINRWHKVVGEYDLKGMTNLLSDDCVFYSPVVFKPQEGKRLTSMYLSAAFQMFEQASYFKYVKEIVQGNQAILEFETELEGITINGIDMIVWNEEGLITEFKVMIRPLQAINKIKDKMLEQLSNLTP